MNERIRTGAQARAVITLAVGLSMAMLTAVGCKPASVGDDGGTPPPDLCNDAGEAKSSPDCQLAIGQYLSTNKYDGGRYISFAGDEDWYAVTLPSTTNDLSLLHVTGGYNYTSPTPNTAVNFFLNVLKQDALTSYMSGEDNHHSAPPAPVDLITTLSASEAGQTVFVHISDAPVDPKHPQFDARHPYDLRVDVENNPDTNEPNDATPTTIAMSDKGGYTEGTTEGYLATPGDVDKFAFDVGSGRKIIYADIELVKVGDPNTNKPPNFRLQYTLVAPNGQTIWTDQGTNQSKQDNLVTARLAAPPLGPPTAGTYGLVIQAYTDVNSTSIPLGDLDYKYTVDLRVMDDIDPHETGASGNDNIGAITSIGLGNTTGRISYVADQDWYKVNVPASGSHQLLHYKLTSTNTSRFPKALPGSPDHRLQIFSDVSGQGTSACLTQPSVCPKGYTDPSDPWASSVSAYCSAINIPTKNLCLYSQREEAPKFTMMSNMEGAVEIVPGGPTSLIIVVSGQGRNWADDNQYTLETDIQSDADEDSHGGDTTGTLASDASPPFGTSTSFTGTLAAGHGFLLDTGSGGFDPSQGQGIIGPNDYDAIVDTDRYVLNIGSPPSAAPFDRMLEVSWTIEGTDQSGNKPYDLAVQVDFCKTGSCTGSDIVNAGTLGFTKSSLANGGQKSWWNQSWSLDQLQPLFTAVGTPVTYTVTPYACLCIGQNSVKGGKAIFTVKAADRTNYDSTKHYTLKVAHAPYPASFPGDGGTTLMCPAPVVTGGVESPTSGCQLFPNN